MNEGQPTNRTEGVRPSAAERPAPRPKKRSVWPYAAGIAVIALAAVAWWNPAGILDRIGGGSAVASVNGTEITKQQYETRLERVRGSLETQGVDLSQQGADEELKNQVLQSLISETLVLQKADEANIQVTDQTVDEEMEEIRARFASEDAFRQELDQNNFTVKTFRQNVHDQLVIQAYLASRIGTEGLEVSDQEVQNTYDEIAASSEEDAPAFDQVREQIRANLEQQKLNQAISPVLEELWSAAAVEVFI